STQPNFANTSSSASASSKNGNFSPYVSSDLLSSIPLFELTRTTVAPSESNSVRLDFSSSICCEQCRQSSPRKSTSSSGLAENSLLECNRPRLSASCHSGALMRKFATALVQPAGNA